METESAREAHGRAVPKGPRGLRGTSAPPSGGGSGIVQDAARRQRPTGERRWTPEMYAALHRADAWAGLPAGTAKQFHLLSAFQEARPYLGLPAYADTLLTFLVKQTRAVDWEEGNRPIVWPSNRHLAEILEVTEGRVKARLRPLLEAGILVAKDSETGKRYGQRDAAGRIIVSKSFGFDLSPLAARTDEFRRLAAAAQAERNLKRELNKRAIQARRGITRVGETLAELGDMPAGWPVLAADAARLAGAVKGAGRSEEMAFTVARLERLKTEAEQWVTREESSYTHPYGSPMGPDTLGTKLGSNPSDTVEPRAPGPPVIQPPASRARVEHVVAPEESSRTGGSVTASAAPCRTEKPQGASPPVARVERLTAAQLLKLVPTLALYVLAALPGLPTWAELVVAAGTGLRTELGVSWPLWAKACAVMGRERAALALALVAAKPRDHFRSSAGGYFAGMVDRDARGELHLDRTVWALREARWGKPDKRRLN